MKLHKLLLLTLFFRLTFTLHSQNYVKADSPIIGEWELVSPKKSPGPEFVTETYIGISVFKLAAGQNISIAAAGYNKHEKKYVNTAEFIAEWDGTKLTGIVSKSIWHQLTNPLQINVPLKYDDKKDRIIIHVNNPEYGNVKFIYKRVRSR